MRQIAGLIVDDSAVMRKIVERALRQAGLDFSNVYGASNGQEALAVLEQSRVDLILSDICMPHMDGMEFVRQVRSRRLAEGAPIVMITTESSEEQVRTAISLGAQGYIRKPFTPDQIRTSVVALLPGVAA